MVAMAGQVTLGASLSLLLLSALASASLLEGFLSDIDPCEDVCQKTYPLHTYEKSLPGACCSRGCRLFSILELLVDRDGVNGTMKLCHDNCRDAYPQQTEESSACILGCNSQKPFRESLGHIGLDSRFPSDGVTRMLDPFRAMHSMYNNLLNQAKLHISSSWSLFVQDSAGKMVIVKSKPQFIDLDLPGPVAAAANLGTSSRIETNIEPAANMATEVSRHSQLKSANGVLSDLNAAESNPLTLDDANSNDWLTCIARKTGMPRLLLSVMMLLSAMALIWLCVSAAVTAPEHRLTQKLSVRSDLDYLHKLPDNSTKCVLPQDWTQARPLPAKLVIRQV